ncbi:T7SS effector LXG polymorphic toxin [Oceanobacillus iheyensis]|uniref:LXG domain-containing protein n=1 Tax=Oceanobacillus iheyensis TaxID=182710 RepID=UPI00364105B7
MGHKVDISEVIELSEDVHSSTADIKTSLNSISESIDRLNSLESFSGKTATNAKNYFNDLHKTILITFEHLFTDLDDSLKKHLEMFQSRVDTSESAIIDSDYVKDLELDIKEDWEKLSLEQDKVRETMNSVSDITSAIHPNYYPPEADKDDVIKIITNLEQELNSFTSVGQEEISSIEGLLNQVATTIENAGTVEGESRFTDYIGTSTTLGLSYLKDYNAEKREVMLDEARKAKDKALKDMDESSQEILNKVYTDLKNGEIEESEYYSYINELKKLQNEENLDEEVSENFIKYVIDNFDGLEDTLEENVIVAVINQNMQGTSGSKLQRSDLIKAMKANIPSSVWNKLKTVGRTISVPLTTGVSIIIGSYNDIKFNDKTGGEAFVKNTAITGTGTLVGTAISAGIKGIPALLGVSTPVVGWAIGGGIAAGTIASIAVKWAYDINFFGIKDFSDEVGKQIDKTVIKGLNTIGEAFSTGLDVINPFS